VPDSSLDDLLGQLADDFVERHRRERPSMQEYADRHPALAGEIRSLFPALVKVEELKPGSRDVTGPFLAKAEPPMRKLGDYVLQREIGRGGMGVVYEAVQESLGRHVALKVRPMHGGVSPTFLERFRREARAAAKLHHTNIVPVFGVGESGGVYYYAMQLIQGEPLDRVLRDLRRLRGQPGGAAEAPHEESAVARSLAVGRFIEATPDGLEEDPTERAAAPSDAAAKAGISPTSSQPDYHRGVARIALQVAQALDHAHRQGVLHRDVKLSNLLLDLRGTAWVADFGLAKAEGDDLTHTGDVVGTLRYMAPERFEGRSLPQSDVCGLGLTLYELLTLRPAFEDADKVRLVYKVQHEPPPPPRSIDPTIPRDLETIVLKCVARDPRDRYATAAALAEDLGRFLADRTIRARRASKAEQAWRWCRRNPSLAFLLAAVAGLLLAVAAVFAWSAARAHEDAGKLRDALKKAEREERAGRLREADALVGKARAIRQGRRPGQRFETLAALKKAAAIGRDLEQPPEWFAPLRNEAIAALALPDVHVTRTWPGFPAGTDRAEVSPDFECYARTTREGACSVRRIADDAVVADLPALGEPAFFFEPRRLFVLAAQSSKRWQVWDLSGLRAVRLFESRDAGDVSFAPNGLLLCMSRADGSIDVLDARTGARKRQLPPGKVHGWFSASVHPNLPLAAVSSYQCAFLEVRHLRTWAVVASLTLPWRGSSGCTSWRPDGRALAVSDGDSGLVHLYAFDPAGPSLTLLRAFGHSGHGGGRGGTAVHFNSAGDRLFTREWDGVVRLFDAANGRLLFSTHALPTTAYSALIVSPTGGRLGAARVGDRLDRIGAWSVADAREYRALIHAGPGRRYHELGAPAVHPGGRLAALGLTDGLAFFDLATGGEAAEETPSTPVVVTVEKGELAGPK
jgi:serine/threonine protein kinase